MKLRLTNLFLCCLFFLQARNTAVDSLLTKLNKAKHDTTRCIVLNALVEAEPDMEASYQYNEQLLNLSETKLKTTDRLSLECRYYEKYFAVALNKAGILAQMKGDIGLALKFFERSLTLQKETGNRQGAANTLHTIGGIYLKEKKYAEALNYANQSMEMSQKTGLQVCIRSAADLLMKVYETSDNYKLVVENYELFISMSDSIGKEESKKEEQKKLLNFEYEKKAAEDSVKISEEKKVSKTLLQQEQSQRNTVLFGLLLVALIVIFLINRIWLTNKQKKLILWQKHLVEDQKKQVDDKQKEIVDSIKYAKRIQTALLPSEKYIERVLLKAKNTRGN